MGFSSSWAFSHKITANDIKVSALKWFHICMPVPLKSPANTDYWCNELLCLQCWSIGRMTMMKPLKKSFPDWIFTPLARNPRGSPAIWKYWRGENLRYLLIQLQICIDSFSSAFALGVFQNMLKMEFVVLLFFLPNLWSNFLTVTEDRKDLCDWNRK